MLLWLSLYYLAPALLCDRLVRLLANRVTAGARRKWLLVFGLTLAWAPLIMSAGERTGPIQFLVAIVHFDADQLEATPLWQQVCLVAAVFLITRYFVVRVDRTKPPTPP